jgi:5'-AMP-activated protein kinase regulatory beta subunit
MAMAMCVALINVCTDVCTAACTAACAAVCTAVSSSALQYKFIVDGDWKHDPNQRAMRDENGNVNNVIEVQEYVPENLENISGFDPPPSPSAR